MRKIIFNSFSISCKSQFYFCIFTHTGNCSFRRNLNMKVRVFFILTLFFSCSLIAQDGFRIPPYLQNPAPEAMSILWFSEGSSPGYLSFWKNGTQAKNTLTSSPVLAGTLAYPLWEDTTLFGGSAPFPPYRHRLRIEDLEPFSNYDYMVVQGADTFRSVFRTSPLRDTSIRFMVYGDSETEPESSGKYSNWPDPLTGESRDYLVDQTMGYRNNLELIRSRDPDLVLIAGDLVQHGGEQRHWDEFWRHNTSAESDQSLAGMVPVLAALGNHDYYEGRYLDGYKQPGSERAVNRYLTYFEYPSNGSSVEEQEGRYYALKYGPATFIVLDVCNNSPDGSDEDTNFYLLGENDPEGGHAPDFGIGSTQFTWMEEVLAEAQGNSLFTFVVFHYAPYSSGPHGYPQGLGTGEDYLTGVPVRQLTPVFMQYGVDAVFSGHDEMWERSEVIGVETWPEGKEESHTIHFFDVGTGGDGLRGPEAELVNPYQAFLVHADAPETWEEGILLGGGKHYGHLEVDILPLNDSLWQAILSPAYVFPLWSKEDSAYTGYERRLYNDRVMLQRVSVDSVHTSVGKLTDALHLNNFPNPFHTSTTIEYHLKEPSMVRLSISDPAGRIIRYLDAGKKSQGDYSVEWDGRGEEGYEASPGFYMISIETTSGKKQSLRLIKQ